MKYSISAGRVKILLWVLAIIQAFFSYSVFNLGYLYISNLQELFIFNMDKLGLINILFNLFALFAPIFLLWAFYQTKKHSYNLIKFCMALILTMILMQLILLVFQLKFSMVIYILIYIDFAMYFKSKITKLSSKI